MADTMQGDDRLLARLRMLGWSIAVAMVATPLILMQVAPQSGFNWTLSDFVFAAALIGGTGLMLEIAVRFSSNWFYRIGAAIALGASFLLMWSNLSVGYIGSEDNPYNLVFFGVVALAVGGALVCRGKAVAMAWVMAAAGIAHAAAGAIGFPQDERTGPITIVFVGLWLLSAYMFRKAARTD